MARLTDGAPGAKTAEAMAALCSKTAGVIYRDADRVAGDEGLTEFEQAALHARWRRPHSGLPACSGFHDQPADEDHICGWCGPAVDWRPSP